MAIIYSYPIAQPLLSDLLLGTHIDPERLHDGNPTKSFTISDIINLVPGIVPYQASYKVFTALLTQNGGDSSASLNYDDVPGGPSLSIGTTYVIEDNADGLDMTNVGAPNNNVGTYFIATGTTPASWGFGILGYNTGAPVATVLENTIGNIWFTYDEDGRYIINSNNLFTLNKTILFASSMNNGNDINNHTATIYQDQSQLLFWAFGNTGDSNENLDNSIPLPIEIRVYN
jgi:hypothetical protein